MILDVHTLNIDTPSPSIPIAISVRLRFFMPLMLHTLAACMRPLVEPTGLDSVARVKGAPMRSVDDILLARPGRGGRIGSAWVVVWYARAVFEAPAAGKKVRSVWQKMDAGGRWTEDTNPWRARG
jgi:hypothetical protein